MSINRKTSISPKPDEGGGDEEEGFNWENESTPLEPNGKGPPKFIKPEDKHSCNEGNNGYVAFQVEGNPAPTVEWFKGFKNLNIEPRYKFWTDGPKNTIILGVHECRNDEEGKYKAVLTNEHGEEEFEFNFYVTVEGGMDFRAMLMKKKRPQKKVVVKKVEWLESPVDQECQEGKMDRITFSARLSEKEKRGKWYLMNSKAFKDVKAQEYGLELYKDKTSDGKLEFVMKDDFYSLTILNPVANDMGKYTLVVKDGKETYHIGANLDVKDKDPEYFFKRKLKDKDTGYTNRPLKLKCILNSPNAKITWQKAGIKLSKTDVRYLMELNEEKSQLTLTIRKCVMEDKGIYTCEILEFVKKEEVSNCDCIVDIQEYSYKFTSKLKGQNVVEHDKCEFEIDVADSDAKVTWCLNGKPIQADDTRIKIISDGKKRKLVICDTLRADCGEISVKTNTDISKCNLRVAFANKFINGMPAKATVVEREPFTATVEVKDPEAPVQFFVGGKKVIEGGDNRVEIRNLGNGKHQLVIHNLRMTDGPTIEARTPSNRGDELLSTCKMDLTKGEEAPLLGDLLTGECTLGPCGPVVGIAHKNCNWAIGYEVDGQQQSPLEVTVIGPNGNELKIGKDINLSLENGKIDMSIINPRREKSGKYKVILKNAQGQSEKDIDVNILDKPTPPQTCKVTDVFYDNCVVNWTPPIDDGGTKVKKYIVEALDVSSGMTQWAQVAVANSESDRNIKVEGLTNKHSYRFRVRAANKLGPSDPCEMLGDDILIKDPWDEPTPPGKPNIEDWGPNHCDLSWKKPDSDGGATITDYEIEYMEKSMGMWEHGITLSAREVRDVDGMLFGKCPGLVEGNEYVFRIKAVNKGGPSSPSPQSESMIAKTRFIKPFIHQPGMYDIEIKKGRTFRYDIWFGGEPPPTITWERNGIGIRKDTRTSIELFSKKTVYCERNSVLTVQKCDRAIDGGTYKIRLICEAGTFEASGYVNVLDVPGKPRSFSPDEIRAEHVKVSWIRPEDDGGTPITGYIIRAMDIENGEWITVAEASSSTCNATVTGLRPGHLYQLEVCAFNKEGESPPARTKDPIKAENPYAPPSPPREPGLTDFDNQSVTLRWYTPNENGGRPITHYVIQKKDRFGGWFDALVTDDANCQATIDELEARVPGLSEGKWYQFRIIAANKAGESFPSFETKPHLCRYKNLKPTIGQGASGSKSVKVNRSAIWHIKCKGEPPPKFSWYKDGELLVDSDEIAVQNNEYQGGSTTMLQVIKSKMSDAGTYTLVAENKNGKDTVNLDLVVLDLMQDCECDMFKTASLQCCCSSGFRQSELSGAQVLEVDFGEMF